MNAKEIAKGLGWFLAYLMVTKLVVSPIVEKVGPKNADGTPKLKLL